MPMLKNKELKRLIRLRYAAMASVTVISVFTVIAAAAELLPLPLAAAVIGVSIFLFAVMLVIRRSVRDELEFRYALEAELDDVAYIKFNTKKDFAELHGDVASLTGIETNGDILSGEVYRQMLEEVLSAKYDLENDIYISCSPEKWIRVNSFTSGIYKCTVIRDVSKYVSNMNMIKSLRYYDSATGVLSKEAFSHKLRKAAENNTDMIGLIHILINGVEKIQSFSGASAAEHAVIKIASFIKKYENPHNAFAGITSSNEFTLAITDTYEAGCRKIVDKIYNGICHVIVDLPENERSYIKVFCGYALFGRNEMNAGSMLAAVDFAAFDAVRQNASKPVEYNSESYADSAHEFKKIQVFNEIISKNLIDYHFQPIVNARTGEIYGYESLMRPQAVDGIKLNPLEMLSIAENQDMLNEIEHMTFFNSLQILSENQDFFRERKMFVNSIPSSNLSDSDYEELYNSYGELFDKLVVEVTESTKISDETIRLLETRYKNHRAGIALDDYGTGYSNESTLISVNPDFIKIDRSIIAGIDSDPQKQHLVSNIIDFAAKQGIKTLAERVETNEELESVISLGIDLIQGFVACKAMSILMLDIPLDVRNSIISYNLKHSGFVAKAYVVESEEPVNIVGLAASNYTEIVIKTNTAYIYGEADKQVNMRIKCEKGSSPTVYFKNVNINGFEGPAITLGKNCALMAVMEGENLFSHEGVRVPATAKFVLSGGGNLMVDCTYNNGVAIGGNSQQDIGQILFDGTGKVSVKSKGDNSIAIGGGSGGADSFIHLISGEFNLDVKGATVLGIGTMTGEIDISLNCGLINGEFGGQYVIGVGSKNGKVNIDSSADINFVGSGDICCLIGVLDKGSGTIHMEDGSCRMLMRAKNCIGIGGINGNMDTVFSSGSYDINGEGNKAKCIGDFDGSGSIRIMNAVINAVTQSSEATNIGIDNGKLVIQSGNIFTNSIIDIEAFSPHDSKLSRYRVINGGKFKAMVKEPGGVYSYSSEPSGLFEGNYVYLPEGYESEQVEPAEITV